MEKGENEVHIREEKCKIEYIKLIGTWPGGSQYVECEYRAFFEKEIVLLHLQIVKESPEYKKMREPSQKEINEDFKRNKDDQKRFFRGEGKRIVIETLIRVGGMEGIRKLGCGQIPYSYVPYSEIATVVIKGIKKKRDS